MFGARLLPAAALLAVAILLSHNTSTAWLGRYNAFYTQLAVLLAFSGAGIAAFSISFNAGRLVALSRLLPRTYILAYLLFTAGCAVGFGLLQRHDVPVQRKQHRRSEDVLPDRHGAEHQLLDVELEHHPDER